MCNCKKHTPYVLRSHRPKDTSKEVVKPNKENKKDERTN